MGGSYEWLRFVHILFAMVAVVPAVIYPLMYARAGKSDDPADLKKIGGFAARYDMTVFTPALVLVLLAGVAIVVDRDYMSFGDSWVSAAFLLWFITVGVLHGLQVPAQRKLAEGDLEAMKLIRIGGVVLILLFLSLLHLMVFRPGVDY